MHRSYGECMRSKGTKVAYCNSAGGQDYTKQRAWDRELDAYRDARAEGLQPAGTSIKKIEDAKRISDLTGTAFRA